MTTAYGGKFKAVEPTPDSELTVSTGPVVPVDEVDKARRVDAPVDSDEKAEDDKSKGEKDAEKAPEKDKPVSRSAEKRGMTTTTAGKADENKSDKK